MSAWNILKVMTLRETVVASNLAKELGLKTYVPIEITRMPKRGVVFERRRPLIPSYVFVKNAGGVPLSVIKRSAPYAVDFLEVEDRPAHVTDMQIDLIREMAREHNKSLHDRRTFRAGDRVRVQDGPFASMEVLLRSLRGSQATIEVPMLGSTRNVKVSTDQLEKVA